MIFRKEISLGKGYYFNFADATTARRAANYFGVKVGVMFKRKWHLGVTTQTLTGRTIASVDVCGLPNDMIDKLHKRVIEDFSVKRG